MCLDWLLQSNAESVKISLYSTQHTDQPVRVRMKLHVMYLPRAKLEAIAESILESDTSLAQRAFPYSPVKRDFTVTRI